MQYDIEVGGRTRQVRVLRTTGRFLVSMDGREWAVDASRIDAHSLSLLVGQASHEVTLSADVATGQTATTIDGRPVVVALNTRRRWGTKDAATSGVGPQRIVAPMPGKIVRVLARTGDAVQARQPLVVIEAMKMENELRATRAGIVGDVHAREGQLVDAGALLLMVSTG